MQASLTTILPSRRLITRRRIGAARSKPRVRGKTEWKVPTVTAVFGAASTPSMGKIGL